MRTWPSSSIPATNGSSSGRASAAPHRRGGRAHVRSRHRRGQARRWCAPAIDPVDIDLVICATATPDRTFPATAVTIQSGARRHQRRGLRRAGRVLGLRLRDGGRRQFPQDGPIQARRRGRCGDVLAHPRLGGPRHLRAVRRRRGRGRARGAAAARHARGPRHPRHAHPLGRTLRGSALRRWRPGLDQDRRGTCA